jgi:hypothetical protein
MIAAVFAVCASQPQNQSPEKTWFHVQRLAEDAIGKSTAEFLDKTKHLNPDVPYSSDKDAFRYVYRFVTPNSEYPLTVTVNVNNGIISGVDRSLSPGDSTSMSNSPWAKYNVSPSILQRETDGHLRPRDRDILGLLDVHFDDKQNSQQPKHGNLNITQWIRMVTGDNTTSYKSKVDSGMIQFYLPGKWERTLNYKADNQGGFHKLMIDYARTTQYDTRDDAGRVFIAKMPYVFNDRKRVAYFVLCASPTAMKNPDNGSWITDLDNSRGIFGSKKSVDAASAHPTYSLVRRFKRDSTFTRESSLYVVDIRFGDETDFQETITDERFSTESYIFGQGTVDIGNVILP